MKKELEYYKNLSEENFKLSKSESTKNESEIILEE